MSESSIGHSLREAFGDRVPAQLKIMIMAR
jgi:hypothetical protein